MRDGRRGPAPARGPEGGNIIIELALVMPFLLLVIAGILDLGWLYWEKNILTNAGREGSRAGALAAVDGSAQKRVSEVQQVVQDYLNRFNLKDADGNNIVLVKDSNFVYSWDLGYNPPRLSVELKNVPVKMMLLPNVQAVYYQGGGGTIVNLQTKTTMAAEWTTAPLP